MSVAENKNPPPVETSQLFWNGALHAFDEGQRDPLQLLVAVEFGVRAAEIEATEILHARSQEFAATIGFRLEQPAPHLYVYRDAVMEPHGVTFTEILDLLSKDELPCVGPRLHRGWEDRRFSCARARKTAQAANGVAIDGLWREKLLRIAAYRNRLFRSTPPVHIIPDELLAAYPALVQLVERIRGLGR